MPVKRQDTRVSMSRFRPKSLAPGAAHAAVRTMPPVPTRHFLQFADFSEDELRHLFARTRWIKERFKRYEIYQPLRDRTLAMVFEKASTRTRVSFEAGMNQLGGIAINLNRHDTQLSRGEPIEDVARVISRMVDVVMIRTFGQDIIERFAAHSRVPVINGLTNEHHPCQILADVYTFLEHRGDIRGRTVAWIGDANNMLTSWLQAAAALDFRVHVSSPVGYEVKRSDLPAPVALRCESFADPRDACRGADLVTTDVWTSMGFEAENDARRRAFADWQVDAGMMRAAKPDALFMHCLPAHRGQEVTAPVIDGPNSIVYDIAENRLHVQKAVLVLLMRDKNA